MGTLTPGATYIYERVGDTIYARESGADPSTRKVVGSMVAPTNWADNIIDRYLLEVEWADILKSAKDNPALQTAIERVKILYHLSKDNE